VKAELKISNIEVVNNRCEDFSVDQGFDTIVSRAFSSLSNMVESTAHLLKPNGQFIAMKGVYPQAEIDALPKGFTVTAVDKIVIKGLNAERHVVSIQRIQG
jgi:16S rRNA (guanine527-N7)-methyltransferase